MTEGEFAERFSARMTYHVGIEALDPGFDRYVKEAASTYWQDPEQREEGPEDCADAEFAYQREDDQ